MQRMLSQILDLDTWRGVDYYVRQIMCNLTLFVLINQMQIQIYTEANLGAIQILLCEITPNIYVIFICIYASTTCLYQNY